VAEPDNYLVISRKLAFDQKFGAWALLIVGILATASAWRYRHPDTTSDFTLFYVSAQHTTARMFEQPPGPPRGNMNPPLFQLMIRPLTAFPLPTAAEIFRLLNVVALVGCIWWLARTSEDRWTLADYGALLAWAPMASVVSLNQLTWILWPPLLWAWWCWRQNRWAAGAIGYGLAVGLKPFLGVFLLWLIVTRRWQAVFVSCLSGAAFFAIGLVVYGVDVNLAWADALGDVTWAYAGMNASLQGLLTRALSKPVVISDPLVFAPELVSPLATAGGAVIVLVTILRTRRLSIDQAWQPLMVSALLASPLGWLYYIWWILPGARPLQLLREAPLLWVPLVFPLRLFPSTWLGLTLGSIYFWGLLSLWLNRICFDPGYVRYSPGTAKRSVALRVAFVSVIFVTVLIARGQYVAATQMIEDDPALGTWALDRSRSTFIPRRLDIVSRTITFSAVDDTIRQITITDIAGEKPERLEYTARFNQKDHLIRGSFLDVVSLNRIDGNTVERLGKIGEEVVETETRRLSPDGTEMTITTRGRRDGTDYSSVEVFRRVS
jgi:Glycosyltransferase family 87